MTMMSTLQEKPLRNVGVAMALGIGASFLLPALRRRVVTAGPALGALLGPMAARLAREGAERVFAFAVEHLQKQQQNAGAENSGPSRPGAKHTSEATSHVPHFDRFKPSSRNPAQR